MKNEFKIGSKTVGNNLPPYFIADIGANHDGSLERAFKLIELAKQSGADAAKFQNFKASKIVSKYGFETLGGALSHQSTWKKSVFEIYEEASINEDWTSKLKKKCIEQEIEYFTSPYDLDSVDKVDSFVELYKIGSGDITWLEIIEHIAKKNKPVLLATGASNINEVELAMKTISSFNDRICLMQCNTNYTLDNEKYRYVNLNVLKTYRDLYPNVILGLSDHTIGHATTVASIALGARIIEKHFTDDNNREGPDHKFAMNPKSWREMVDNSNQAFYALGDGVKKLEENERDSIIVQRRSLRATENLKVGEIIEQNMFEALRPIPTDGIAPYLIKQIVGKKLTKALNKGEHLTLTHLS